MDLGLKGKSAIVTAASRGLGLATARSLAREGVNVTINARSAEALGAADDTLLFDFVDPQEGEAGSEAEIRPYELEQGKGSTDVGDVSWTVPTVGLRAATWVPGTSAHTWQAIAAGGTSIGHKGMMVAARSMALTVADMFEDSALLRRAQAECEQRRGADFDYRPLLGDREPPLDYRVQ